MTEPEAIAKVTIAIAVIVGIIALGYMMILVVAPLLVLSLIIDTVMRAKYNANLATLEKTGRKEVSQPAISNFDVRYHDGQVVIGWLIDLPAGTALDVYRSDTPPRGALEGMPEEAVFVGSSSLDFTNSMDDVMIDPDAAEGVHYYIPVIAGTHIEKTPIDYSLFSFSRSVQFTTRKRRINARGDAVRVEVTAEAEHPAITDERDEATKMTDDILAAMSARNKRDSDLDAAIDRIRNHADLNDAEKEEAIELLETRLGAQ